MTKEITWHSKTCACAFVMQFEYSPEQATDTRAYVPVRRAHGEERHYQVPNSRDFAVLPATSCAEHDAMGLQEAFVAVCEAHEAAGIKKDLRKVSTASLRLDTCGCVIEYEFDSAADGEDRKHFVRDPLQMCDHHQIPDPKEHHKSVISENRKKNEAREVLIKSLPPEAFVEEEDFEGNVTKRLKFEPQFSFDDKRNLKFKVHAGIKKHVGKLKTALSKEFPGVDVE